MGKGEAKVRGKRERQKRKAKESGKEKGIHERFRETINKVSKIKNIKCGY